MYKNILVPVLFDESHDTEASFRAARTLADEGAKFTVMHVLEPLPAYMATTVPPEVFIEQRETLENLLEKAAASLPNCRSVLKSGHPGTTIVEFAKANDVDCIIIASHQPGFEDYFLGSTAARVVRHAKCAVHVLR